MSILSEVHLPKRKIVLLAFVLLLPAVVSAHAIDMSQFSRTEVGWMYLKLGYEHIIPLGLDHILFVLSLFFLSSRLKTVIWQATAFTVAHSITLGLAMYNVISPPTYIVEPVIVLSIMFVAIENIISDKLRPSRVLIVFCFGLIHGLGFASALTSLGLPKNQFLTSLLTFNLGVELGQVTIILLAWLLIGMWFHRKEWYRSRVVIPISTVIALVALYWTIERTFFPS
ncbi:MAG: HupE/UreJ family protein [Bacteroidia bacterium]